MGSRCTEEHVTDHQVSDGPVREAQRQGAAFVDAFEHAADGVVPVERGSNRDAFAQAICVLRVRGPDGCKPRWRQSASAPIKACASSRMT